MNGKICGLVPVYNNHLTIANVVHALLEQLDFVIVVDDGSNDGTEKIVKSLKEKFPDKVEVLHHAENKGKGAAVQSGLHRANDMAFSNVIQVDADGQHNLDDLPKFLQGIEDNPRALFLGAPIFDGDIPAIRKHGRKLTQAMIAMEMGTWDVPDAMCGFRAYPVAEICELGCMDPRMSFDPEVMIRAHWAGILLQRIPTRVRYLAAEDGGISHFRMVNDNVRHTWIHIRLLLQAPFRLLLKAIRKSHE
ncbi:MAG: glycosyltransferase family 2 protein [Mariprofundaceae bacterium]|nr:glycosyltransferase family 2 protein [Mariprofundaceae bacterium]